MFMQDYGRKISNFIHSDIGAVQGICTAAPLPPAREHSHLR